MCNLQGPVSPTCRRLAEFFGPIKSAKNAVPFPPQKIWNSKLDGVKKLNFAVKIELNMFLNVKF